MYDKTDLKDIAPVEGTDTTHGTWVRATGPGAARIADQISGHGIGRWIADRFSDEKVSKCFEEHPDGALPEYYMLVDNPLAPTISHVSLGAHKGPVWGVTSLMDLPLSGIAGARKTPVSVPAEMKGPVRNLADVEGLALDRKFTGEGPAKKWTLASVRFMNMQLEGVVWLVASDDRGRTVARLGPEFLHLLEKDRTPSYDEIREIGGILVRGGKILPDAGYFPEPGQAPDGSDHDVMPGRP